jgi:hypothetical protein
MSQPFTPEQIASLRANPYVLDVTPHKLFFTVEFKKRFLKDYQEGRMPGSILRDMGLDTDMLGQKRVDSISHHVRKQAASAEGIHPRKPTGAKKKPKESCESVPVQTAPPKDKTHAAVITMLTHRVAFLEQQMEFLKKTISAGAGRKSQ